VAQSLQADASQEQGAWAAASADEGSLVECTVDLVVAAVATANC
jgi:hypothetical protein